MNTDTTIHDFHGRLLRDTFATGISDSDAFLVFALIHLYQIEVAGPVLNDCPKIQRGDRIPGLTQRGCAAALASIWQGTGDARANYTYWYVRWNGEWEAYHHVENLKDEERSRLRLLIGQLERHPFVQQIVPEDWDLFETDA